MADLNRPERTAIREPSVASLYASVLMIGERTNANGSKAFCEAMIAEDWQRWLDIAEDQTRDGAHLLDLCVDVGDTCTLGKVEGHLQRRRQRRQVHPFDPSSAAGRVSGSPRYPVTGVTLSGRSAF